MKNQQRAQNTYSIYGINGCRTILESEKHTIETLYLQKDGYAMRDKQLVNLCQSRNNSIKILDKTQFKNKWGHLRTQGIILHFKGTISEKLPSFGELNKDMCLLILDHIEDPQNLGQIIRTAECAGIDGILIPKYDSCGFTETVLQVSQGAFVHIPLYEVNNINQSISRLKEEGFWILGMENSLDAKPWHQLDMKGKTVIIFGSEGKGIRQLVLKSCDFLGTIPMEGKSNSLNVSAAVSAVLFERRRQLTD